MKNNPIVILAVVGLILYALAVMKIWNVAGGLFKEDKDETAEEKKQEKNTAAQLKKEVNSGKKLYLNPEQLSTIAAALYKAKGKFGVGNDDEETVYRAFRILSNNADYLALKLKFQELYKEDLTTYLRSFLSESERKTVNFILSGKKITYGI